MGATFLRAHLDPSWQGFSDDGSEEVFGAGDVILVPAGHTAIVGADTRFVVFSPTKELDEVIANVDKK
jgi:hypothetical protein